MLPFVLPVLPPFALTAWKITSSRTGIIVIICAGLWLWHTLDKSSAVRRAVIGYVAHTELETARAEAAEFKRRAKVFEAAKQALEIQLADAGEAKAAAEKRIADYERTTPVAGDGRVSADLYLRLRNP